MSYQRAYRARAIRLPRESGPHRIACFALYRTLLKQCLRIPLPDDLPPRGPVNPIKHLIRKGFKRHVNLTSPPLIKDALEVGYNAEVLLRLAANGNKPSITQTHSILQALEKRRAVSAAQPRPTRSENPRIWPYPNAPKVLDTHPLPQSALTGKRHVPKIVESNGIPFLRLRKPQSTYLSHVLGQKLKRREKRWAQTEQMEEEGFLAELEDEWESAVADQAEDKGREDSVEEENREPRWTASPKFALELVYDALYKEQEGNQERGSRMVKIMERERELFEEERNECKRARRIERMASRTGISTPEAEDDRVAADSAQMEPPKPPEHSSKEAKVLYVPILEEEER